MHQKQTSNEVMYNLKRQQSSQGSHAGSTPFTYVQTDMVDSTTAPSQSPEKQHISTFQQRPHHRA
jgi:hypothetical protein